MESSSMSTSAAEATDSAFNQVDHSTLFRRVFEEWARATHEKQIREKKRRQAVRFHYFHTLRIGFDALAKAVQVQKRRLQLLQRVVEKKTQAKCFYIWSEEVRRRKELAQRDADERRHCLSDAFHQWRVVHAMAVQVERDMRTAAHVHHNRLLRSSFGQWQHVIVLRRTVRANADAFATSRQLHLEQAMVLSCFLRWREHAEDHMVERLMSHRARAHHQEVLVKHTFHAWVQFVGMRKWDEILYLRAAKHQARIVLQHRFATWRDRIVAWRGARERTTMALLHWKQTMQRRAFLAWIQGMRLRQAKRHFRHEALEWRHTLFLRQGLAHWTHAAFALQEQRLHDVQRRAAAAAERVWRRVARIAMHWRYVAAHGLIQGCGRPANRHQSQVVARSHPRGRLYDDGNYSDLQPLGMSSAAVVRQSVASNCRPPPRKPLDLLYETGELQVSNAKSHPLVENASIQRDNAPLLPPLGDAWKKYGMHLPVSSSRIEGRPWDVEHAVREMETRVLVWQTKKQEWKRHKAQLDDVRRLLADAATPPATRDVLQRTVEVMEATHREHVAAHVASKGEMKALAQQIEELRRRGEELN
ncbi:Aste57867_12907 [Aphanomyces stellatus]|uniref:Aste57867_12907 protein n=1 Tax=Aphanomyces stellatus TaxID=120398 RepID=A0A485KYU7_9STRA|nr:hypothetical protein As57867_012859 [Aphanomyces stellatus]VFT89754.1 Aste57867_12907 [Aphanomyces stellatus]